MESSDQERFSWFDSVARSLHAATIDMLPQFSIEDVENKNLTKVLRIPCTKPVPSSSHNLIRTILRIRCKEGECTLEKADFTRDEVVVRIVMERRIRPVWGRKT